MAEPRVHRTRIPLIAVFPLIPVLIFITPILRNEEARNARIIKNLIQHGWELCVFMQNCSQNSMSLNRLVEFRNAEIGI